MDYYMFAGQLFMEQVEQTDVDDPLFQHLTPWAQIQHKSVRQDMNVFGLKKFDYSKLQTCFILYFWRISQFTGQIPALWFGMHSLILPCPKLNL